MTGGGRPDPGLPQVDGYDILAVLGHGGMGVVYKARHRRLNRLVALKMIQAGNLASPEERLRFRIAALDVFAAADARGDGWTLASLPPSLTEQDRDEIALGCYEMLMVLAEATARPRPGEAAERQARDAIRILDRAAGLRRQPTHASHLRRAACLERAGDAEGAMRERTAAGRIEPDGAFDHFLSGLELYKRGLPAQAGRHFQVALRVQPGHFWSQWRCCTKPPGHRRGDLSPPLAGVTSQFAR